MRVLIFRHGIAEDDGPDGTDASRRLTTEGKRKTKEAARGIARVIEDAVEVILSSPLTRAWETAGIAAKEVGGEVEELAALGRQDPAAVIEAIAGRPEELVMLVGHEPMLSTLIQVLCGFGGAWGSVELKKAGCALVEVERAGVELRGRLLWLSTPKMLRMIGGEQA